MNADNDTFVCAECDEEFPVRPSVVTGVTTETESEEDIRQLCIGCWSNGDSMLVGYSGP